jgi:hypothetical protein
MGRIIALVSAALVNNMLGEAFAAALFVPSHKDSYEDSNLIGFPPPRKKRFVEIVLAIGVAVAVPIVVGLNISVLAGVALGLALGLSLCGAVLHVFIDEMPEPQYNGFVESITSVINRPEN